MSKEVSDQILSEQQLGHRMLGAIFWLLLVVWWVPKWYAHPVNFKPPMTQESSDMAAAQHLPIAQKSYHLPTATTQVFAQQEGGGKSHQPFKISDSDKVRIHHRLQTSKAHPKPKNTTSLTRNVPESIDSEDLTIDLAKQTGWFIRVASLSQMEKANVLLGKLQDEGYEGYIQPSKTKNYAVIFIGTFPSKVVAQQVKRKIDKKFYVDSLVFYRKKPLPRQKFSTE